jgi:diacylglycerol kinase family enzyme
VTETNKLGYLNGNGRKCQSPAKDSQISRSEQALEVALLTLRRPLRKSTVTTATAFWKWRDDGNILLTKTNRLTVQSNKGIPATQDRETVNLGTCAEIDFVPHALTVLVPTK